MRRKFKLTVPARLASERLPGKVLMEIKGRPMLRRVLDQCSKAVPVNDIYVVTPDKKISDLAEAWGYQCCSSNPRSPNGTFAIASIASQLDAEYIINIQADQPLISPSLIRSLIDSFAKAEADIITPVYRIADIQDIKDIGIAKVVRDLNGWALYFSRSPIPFVRNVEHENWVKTVPYWGHYGIYGYKKEVLLKLNKLRKSYLESAEKLEQLLFLQNGIRIFTFETEYRQLAVDTAEDLKGVLKYIDG